MTHTSVERVLLDMLYLSGNNNNNNQLTSIAPISLETKLRGASKQKGLIDLIVGKQIKLSSD